MRDGPFTTRIAPEFTDQQATGTARPESLPTRLSPQPKSSPQTERSTKQDIYPHVYDPDNSEDAALVLRDLQTARSEISIAITEFTQGNLITVAAQLSLVAVRMAKAHKLSSFNEALGGVISHVRRSTLNLDPATVSLEQLMLLNRVLGTLHSAPMIALGEAADLVVSMEDIGLTGDIPQLDALIASLLGSAEESPQQTLDFSEKLRS